MEKKPIKKIIFGKGNFIRTENGNEIIEVIMNVDKFNAEFFTEREIYEKVEKYAGFLSAKGELFIKMKLIPLKEKQASQTHILILDYYDPDEKEEEKAKSGQRGFNRPK